MIMTAHRIISVGAVALLLIDLLWFLLRLLRGRGGRKPAEKGFLLREVMIYLCSAAIIVLCFFMDFGVAGNFVLNGCAVLAAEIANRQWLNPDEADKSVDTL